MLLERDGPAVSGDADLVFERWTLFLRMTAYPAAVADPGLFRAVARRVNLLDRADALQ